MTNYEILKEYEEHKTPVPSYEEWKSAYECQLMESEEVLTLKELLKECREWVEFMEEKSRADENYKGTMYFKNLLTKIDEVLK